ncbi:hypothetical protein DAI22_03g283250 [Oryza sativa Japonica Group]|nr:hypothetical protein DAI22_03g283250 [Oryza sativa Japonica Group]
MDWKPHLLLLLLTLSCIFQSFGQQFFLLCCHPFLVPVSFAPFSINPPHTFTAPRYLFYYHSTHTSENKSSFFFFFFCLLLKKLTANARLLSSEP